MDKDNKTLGIFLDLSKAFDLDQKILFGKLDMYGLRGIPWKWSESYLRNRLHYVENVRATLIYENYFPHKNCIMYANDTSLLVTSDTVTSRMCLVPD